MASGTVWPTSDYYNTWNLHYAESMAAVINSSLSGNESVDYGWHDTPGALWHGYYPIPNPPAGEGYSAFAAVGAVDGQHRFCIVDKNGNSLSPWVYGNGTSTWTPSRLLSRAEYDALAPRVALEKTGSGITYVYDDQLYVAWYTADFPSLSVDTTDASLIRLDRARLSGSFTTGGYPVQYWFQYGRTAAYGQSTAVGNTSANSANPVADISGLVPGTTYHYRLVVKNTVSNETFYGDDMTFTTMRGLVAVI